MQRGKGSQAKRRLSPHERRGIKKLEDDVASMKRQIASLDAKLRRLSDPNVSVMTAGSRPSKLDGNPVCRFAYRAPGNHSLKTMTAFRQAP